MAKQVTNKRHVNVFKDRRTDTMFFEQRRKSPVNDVD